MQISGIQIKKYRSISCCPVKWAYGQQYSDGIIQFIISMSQLITGIHHVTAISSDVGKNIAFYAGILGLRLVKKTVNFDAPNVYHFYYGDESGTPGSILSFFPYSGLRQGRQGKGMVNTTTFSAAAASMNFWMRRLNHFGVPFKGPQERYKGETVIYFEDRDGLGLEIVFNELDQRQSISHRHIPAPHALKGLFNVEIWEEGYERLAGLLTEQLNYRVIAERNNRFRFAITDQPGHYIDILCAPDSLKGLAGSGTVHHLAFATPDSKTQEKMRHKIVNLGLNPTLVLDRKYFTSFYFKVPNGVLFEVATLGPGFTVDEPLAHLGESLKLPLSLEGDRIQIEKALGNISNEINNYT
jgi:glyoxalase family protein